MIGLLLLHLLTADAAPSTLFVRDHAGREARIPLVSTATGMAVRPDLLRPVLDAMVKELPRGRYLVIAGAMRIEVADGVPFAKLPTRVVPLASAPFVREGKLHVPLQVFLELLPKHDARFVVRSTGGQLSLVPRAVTVVSPKPAAASAPKRWRVVVDAGHGGHDPGTVGKDKKGAQLEEKTITLAVATILAKELKGLGMDVVMTRDKDVYVALDERGRLANQHAGDVFVSVHVNAGVPGQSSPRGLETYFLSAAKSAEAQRVADMENEAARFDSSARPRDDAVSFILNDMVRNEFLRESGDLATAIQGKLGPIHPGGDHGVRQAPFRVLVTSNMPAVLVELGYMTNPGDALYLTSPANQKKMASVLAGAVVGYLRDYERRLGAAPR